MGAVGGRGGGGGFVGGWCLRLENDVHLSLC